MRQHHHSNRSLAAAANVSESAVRNLLKFGVEAGAKDPEARTLTQVAHALEVDPIRLFRLAGYIQPERVPYSVRAEFLAETFDELSEPAQDAIMGALEAMTAKRKRKAAIRKMRFDEKANPLAGVDLEFPPLLRLLANQVIAHYQMTTPADVDKIEPEVEILQYKWSTLPTEMQERIKALIRRKLSLDYDPTMVDEEWRR